MDYKKVKLGDSNSIPQSMWSTDDNILCEDGKTLRENLKNILIGASGIEWLDIEGDEIFQSLVPCTGITLSSSSLSFTTNTTQTLTANVQPVDTSDKVIWSVSPIGIASVNNGEVTPLSNGDCIITATCGNYSTTCNVNVSLPVIVECTGITLSSNALTFTTSDAQTLTVTVEPSDCTQPVVWSVEPSGVANITNNIVTPLINGDCTITATCGTQLATCSVNISCFEVIYTITNNLTNVTSNNSAASIAEGATYTATLTANENYEITSYSVLMAGDDITGTAYSDGVITIENVIGDIVVTANATRIASPSSNQALTFVKNDDGTMYYEWDKSKMIEYAQRSLTPKAALFGSAPNSYKNDTYEMHTLSADYFQAGAVRNDGNAFKYLPQFIEVKISQGGALNDTSTVIQENEFYLCNYGTNNSYMLRVKTADIGDTDVNIYVLNKIESSTVKIPVATEPPTIYTVNPDNLTTISIKQNDETAQYVQCAISNGPSANIYSGYNTLFGLTAGNANLSGAAAGTAACTTALLSIKFYPGTFTDLTLDNVKSYLTENTLTFYKL